MRLKHNTNTYQHTPTLFLVGSCLPAYSRQGNGLLSGTAVGHKIAAQAEASTGRLQ